MFAALFGAGLACVVSVLSYVFFVSVVGLGVAVLVYVVVESYCLLFAQPAKAETATTAATININAFFFIISPFFFCFL